MQSFRCLALFFSFLSAQASPTFTIPDTALRPQPVVIAYGDIRFTNPSEKFATNPTVRRWIVNAIAKEKPDALLINGDVPWHGANESDYEVFKDETKPWRDENLRVYPVLGNHELYAHNLIDNTAEGLKNWWNTFPYLQGKRWYSVQLGSKLYVLNLDSTSSLLKGSKQRTWIEQQLSDLPSTIEFVLVNLHHPPVADVQRFGDPTHNPRHNEISLARYLNSSPLRKRVRFVITAAHIHNYERFSVSGNTYLVSGGGGAAPRAIHRTSADLFQKGLFPNYNYVKFVLQNDTLQATMYRVADPNAPSTPTWETPDHFTITAPANQSSSRAKLQ